MLRILSPCCAEGPQQMALDEALLDCPGPPSLRLYTWHRPTLSLGTFQDHDAVVASLPIALPVVRRITGGGAIWHGQEITYAIAFDAATDGLPDATQRCYPALHAAIAQALADAGAMLQTAEHTTGDPHYRQEPRCFASPAADDLLAPDGGKVLGSAGRMRAGRILIHGSLKLASNPWDGPAVTGCGLDRETASRALTAGLCAFLGGPGEAGDWTTAEQAQAHRILTTRYGDEGWVRHRRGPRA